MSDSSSPTPSSGLLRLGMALAALLMLAALGLFYLSLGDAPASDAEGTSVTITASGCEPNALTVPAGRHRFTVINESERAIEWEILDGVMVLEERENIAPQLHQQITASLQPGEYQMTCGLLSNPHGTLTVTAVEGQASIQSVSAKTMIGPLAEYRVYLILQGRELQKSAEALQRAIADDDLAAAQQAFVQARLVDQRMALAAGMFSDLDQRLNARADYFAEREQDPDFVGFHRLAEGLFVARSTADLAPVAKQLSADVALLTARLQRDGVPASQLTKGSARVLRAWHDYQQSQPQLNARELADLRGLQQGAGKVVSLLSPLLQGQPQLAEALQQSSDGLAQTLQEAEPDRVLLLQQTEQLTSALAQANEQLTPAY
ncbi:iron uptake system protein EfeO [Pseudomonas neustonica]|uniref:Iron uptake system component EfeO n=1 Tax=Pseudomonas neustonica TaxID=2487346 RepID=A0ABX9XF15_9PSED|nr:MULTISPECIES: iron uptake system protein EfeO [Pseudomonas]ROZ81124.1 multidrug DMT transporter permease [Pseudomonas sp. SSM44]ROZ82367.1 multidrug DMT transporter permease [Pseudomonas neustonica]